MNEFMLKDEKLENLIYEIRGVQVMLDSDLARLYECKNGTKQINLAVKRHKDRFPERFVFQLTYEECKNISRFQTETLNKHGYNIKYLPYVFTEQGVAMLATVIRTDVAAQVSIKIMDAFVLFRKYISSNLMEQKYINDLVLRDHEKLEILETYFEKLEEKKKSSEIYFYEQIYDAYSKIQEIFASCQKKLIIIDSLMAHFRAEYVGRESLATRQQKLNQHLHTLQTIANTYNVAVLITNQVQSKPDSFFGTPTKAVGGHVLGHASTYRILLKKGLSGKRIARLVDSPHLPEGESVFKVTTEGLVD